MKVRVVTGRPTELEAQLVEILADATKVHDIELVSGGAALVCLVVYE